MEVNKKSKMQEQTKTQKKITQESSKEKSKRITREEYEQVKKEYLEEKKRIEQEERENAKLKKKNKSPLSFFRLRQRGNMNRSLKKPGEILVFLLNLKKELEGPILTRIYGGNFLVIRNKVYRFNPDRVFTFNKYKVVIAKEYDRELVGIDDYNQLVAADFNSSTPGARTTINDPVLIKALINARLGEKESVAGGSKKAIIIGVIILILVVGFFMIKG